MRTMIPKLYRRLFVLLGIIGTFAMPAPAFAGLAASVTVASGHPWSGGFWRANHVLFRWRHSGQFCRHRQQ
ncbi:MAG: hypothetical protein FJX22_01070 [Alphaproteobacteria bacterium]|nr:hypothetical protein [Alphaproteobacteria bacterium]